MGFHTAYGYASSPVAEKLGMGKTGAYYVVRSLFPQTPISPGFKTHAEAREWAKQNGGINEQPERNFYRYDNAR